MIDVLCTATGVFTGLAAYIALDLVLPHDIRWNHVGGLRHWRFGRIGGSLYIRKGR